ncbi:MAG: helix-turn-helix domain-containing protein [Cyclobacteriaceae bacterium]
MNLKLPIEIQQEMAKKAKNLRKQHQFTQAALAHQSGVTLASLKRFEQSGKIALDSLLKIAFVLNALEGFEGLFEPKKELPKSLDEILKKQQK